MEKYSILMDHICWLLLIFLMQPKLTPMMFLILELPREKRDNNISQDKKHIAKAF